MSGHNNVAAQLAQDKICTNKSEPASDAMMWLLQGAAVTHSERAEADLSNDPVSASKQSNAMLQEALDLHEELLHCEDPHFLYGSYKGDLGLISIVSIKTIGRRLRPST